MTLALFALCVGIAAARADDFVLENVAIPSGDITYKAARLDVSGSPLTRDAAQALLADDKVAPSDRWSKFSAARAAAAEISSQSSAATNAQIVTYRDVVFEDVVAGRIGRASAAGASFSMQTPDGGAIGGRTGAISLAGIDLPGLLHMLIEGRATPDEVARTVIASGTIEAVEVDLPGGGSGRIGKVSLRDAGGRALAVPMTSLVDIAPTREASPPSPERRRALSGLAADMLTSQSLGALDLGDVEVRAGSDGVRVKRQKRRPLGRQQGSDCSVSASIGFAIEGGGPASLSFDRFALTGVDLAPVLVEALKDNSTPTLPRFARMEVGGVAYSAGGVGQAVNFKVAKAALDASAWRDNGPNALMLSVDHFAFDLPTDDPRARPLLDLGYRKLDLSLGADAAYDADKSELTLKTVRVTGPDLGTAEMSVLLTSVGPDAVGRDIEKARTALAASLFRRATMTVKDDGLLSRMIETQARRSSASIADTRAKWAAGMRASVMSLLAENADRGTVADAAERFVRNGGKLSVNADTASGLGMIDAMLAGGAGALLGKVKFTASN